MSIQKFKSLYESNEETDDIREYLSSLDNKFINELVDKWDNTKDQDILNDILLEVDDIVDDDKFQWVNKKIKDL